MEMKEILTHVDHTQLKPYCTWEDIKTLCEEAIEYHTASVCIPSCYISRVKETFGDKVKICTVVGFPLGYCVTEAKAAETVQALEDGADEIDMVINITDVKNGDFESVMHEISILKALCKEHVLKVIIETCYLTDEEIEKVCSCVTEGRADYIKTSTGFGTAGATLEHVKLMKENIGSHVKIKAAGGIRTKEDMEAYLNAGCDRIGCSAAVELAKAEK
ncbi:MAG: deoxyribose-phosphate aldolase [Lachnospiraceae bacterium]|nr:deoxyribose-phosphate aldolase [Lachnospiraceae bacterium]